MYFSKMKNKIAPNPTESGITPPRIEYDNPSRNARTIVKAIPTAVDKHPAKKINILKFILLYIPFSISASFCLLCQYKKKNKTTEPKTIPTIGIIDIITFAGVEPCFAKFSAISFIKINVSVSILFIFKLNNSFIIFLNSTLIKKTLFCKKCCKFFLIARIPYTEMVLNLK